MIFGHFQVAKRVLEAIRPFVPDDVEVPINVP